MRKWMMVLAVLTVVLTMGSKNTGAQTQINIGPIGGNSSINFTGAGASATMTFGSCGSSGSCTLNTNDYFLLNNVGTGGFSSSTFVTTSNASYALTATNSTGSTWSVSGPAMTYTFSSGAGAISGTVVWNQVVSNGGASLYGTFQVNSVSGQLASYYTLNGKYTIDFISEYCAPGTVPCPGLQTIFASSTTTSATASLGESGAIPTPEPSAMLLYGTGMLLAGVLLRRRLI